MSDLTPPARTRYGPPVNRRLGVAACMVLALAGSLAAQAEAPPAAPSEPTPAPTPSEPTPAPTPSERALAREVFEQGVAAVKAGQWDAAYTSFRRAYALTQDPRILMNLAAAQKKTGRLVEAQESYRTLRAQARAAGLADQSAAIERLITELQASLSRVLISVAGLEPGDEVRLDDVPVSAAVVGSSMPVDPGSRTVSVRRAGVVVAERELQLREGETREVRLDARPLPPPPAPLSTMADPVGAPVEETNPWLWIGLGLAVVAGGTAIAVLASRPGEPYAGSTGIVLQGLRW